VTARATSALPATTDSGGADMSLITDQSPTLLDRLPANVAVLDRDGVVSQVNQRWCRFARDNGYGDDRLGVGLSYLDVCARARGASAQGAAEMHAALTRILAGDEAEFRIEYPCHSPQGKRWFLAVAGALGDGAVDGAVVMHFDVSERWRAQLQVRELENEMARITSLALLGEVAAELGHEVNQPLTAALSFLYAAGKRLDGTDGTPTDPAVLRDLIGQAEGQVDRAGRIIGDLRRFVGRLAPAIETIDAGDLVQEAVTLATLGARRHGVSVTAEVAPDLTAIRVDRLQVTQMLINLLRNAIEAVEDCRQASVTVAAERRGQALVLTVADTGPGLPPDKAAALFQAFVTGRAGGLGLGLAIARRVAEAHGGTIAAENRPGGGAIFRVELPGVVVDAGDRACD
jgi:signal transduction histidine kinase